MKHYVMRLYVTGQTPNSMRAIANLRRICEEYLAGQYKVDVIDVYEHPELAESDQIVATPTLLRQIPTPLRKIIGDLSNEERVLVGLDLQPNRDKEALGRDG